MRRTHPWYGRDWGALARRAGRLGRGAAREVTGDGSKHGGCFTREGAGGFLGRLVFQRAQRTCLKKEKMRLCSLKQTAF